MATKYEIDNPKETFENKNIYFISKIIFIINAAEKIQPFCLLIPKKQKYKSSKELGNKNCIISFNSIIPYSQK